MRLTAAALSSLARLTSPTPSIWWQGGYCTHFQNIRLFAEMTALENVMVGRHVRTHSGCWGPFFVPRFQEGEAAIAERAQELLDYVGIGNGDYKARTLSYGDQRRLKLPARWRPTRTDCPG